MAELIIFYSWQSDLPNRTNRGLIGDALERATKAIHSDQSLDVVPVVDRDTLNVPGAPDIAGVILAKMDKAAVVVADVSIVGRCAGRAVPNPNVLVEFGYALKAVGEKRVIPVFNLHYGAVEDLPFDLRGRRVLTYTLGPEEPEAGEERRALQAKLEAALRGVLLHTEESDKQQRRSAFISGVLGDLVTIQLFGDEAPRRAINPWHDEVLRQFASCAKHLRVAGTDDVAQEIGLSGQIERLAARLDTAAHNRRALGSQAWNSHLALIDASLEDARSLQALLLLHASAGEGLVQAVRSELAQVSRQLRSWVGRIESAEQVGRELLEEMIDTATGCGEKMARMSYYPVPGLPDEKRTDLRGAGQDLHLLRADYRSRTNAGEANFEKIKRAIEVLEGLSRYSRLELPRAWGA